MSDLKKKPKLEAPEFHRPFPPTPSASIAGRTMQESVYRQRVTPRRLPADAPNILIVLIDDAGPGLPTTFGGEVHTPTMDRIVGEGIAYNRFHTTAMCSPTRASLLTGRNHHRVGTGQIAELANDWDGYSGHIPKSSALVAEVLKDYGYATGAWGKWHNTPAGETMPTGPFENWPTGSGSNISTASWLARRRNTNRTWCATRPASCRRKPWTRATTSAKTSPTTRSPGCISTRPFQPDKPFFMYWASGAIHGPHHVPKEWADKYKGKFDDGWDAYRERVFHRAKKRLDFRQRGAHPAARDHAVLGQHPRGRKTFPAPPDGSGSGLRRACGCPGRGVVDEIDEARLRRQYVDLLIWGDNGSSSEGQGGTISELLAQNGIPDEVKQHIDRARGTWRPGRAWLAPDRQHVPCGLGLGRQHALQGDQAPGVAFRRHAQPHGGPLAGQDQARRHAADAVPSCATTSSLPSTRSSASPRPHGERRRARPYRRREFRLHLGDRRPRANCSPSISRSWAAAPFITTAGWHAPSGRAPRGSRGCRRHSRVDAGQGRLGTLQPGGRLEPVQRPRRQNAREAGPDEGNLPHRGGEE